MTAGFRARDASTGNFTIDASDRLCRIAGRTTITSAPGSFTIPTGDGTAFFYVIGTIQGGNSFVGPPVSQNGNSLSWPSIQSQGYPANTAVNFVIVYGYY